MHDLDISTKESFEYDFEQEGVFGEAEINELASELMEVQNEAELEQFLGDLIKKAGSAVGSFIKSPTGQALGGLLKGAAKQVLPMAGGALGGMIGGDAGAQLGSKLGSFASDRLEMEGEEEFETAKDFVRMAGEAVKQVATAPGGANPSNLASAAISKAAATHLPGLLSSSAGTGQRGTWVRRGNRIILLAV